MLGDGWWIMMSFSTSLLLLPNIKLKYLMKFFYSFAFDLKESYFWMFHITNFSSTPTWDNFPVVKKNWLEIFGLFCLFVWESIPELLRKARFRPVIRRSSSKILSDLIRLFPTPANQTTVKKIIETFPFDRYEMKDQICLAWFVRGYVGKMIGGKLKLRPPTVF